MNLRKDHYRSHHLYEVRTQLVCMRRAAGSSPLQKHGDKKAAGSLFFLSRRGEIKKRSVSARSIRSVFFPSLLLLLCYVFIGVPRPLLRFNEPAFQRFAPIAVSSLQARYLCRPLAVCGRRESRAMRPRFKERRRRLGVLHMLWFSYGY